MTGPAAGEVARPIAGGARFRPRIPPRGGHSGTAQCGNWR